MTDYSELVNDLREYLTTRQISDLLEAQAKEIATLKELRNEYRRAITLLKEDTRARIAELEASNKALRDALAPLLLAVEDLLIYVELPRDAHTHWLTLDRNGRAALNGEKG
jgi:hypothetical protein